MKLAFMIHKRVKATGHLLLVALLAFSIPSCKLSKKYPGYSRAKHGIYYQLLSFEESDRKPQVGDYITVNLQYSTLDDTVFFNGTREFQLTEPEFRGSIDECFFMLSQDESANFLISADNFFERTLSKTRPAFLPEGSKLKVFIELVEIQSEIDYLRQKEAFLNWIEDFGEYERVVLKQYFEKNELTVAPVFPGLYYLQVREGNGTRVAKKDTITVHYEGMFLNGKFFDSTKKRDEPFQFVYGTKWQVIPGLEKAIGLMEEGEKAIVILKSDNAWGEKGSSTGIIPPYTSLIFELEMLEVKKAD